MKKLLFKITGIITWGQSKLVTTINGAFGCCYGVLQTLEGVGLHSLVLGLAHCTPSNVDALVTFDNLPEKKRMDLVRLWSDHYVARPPRRAVPRKIRFTLRLCPLNTEIFSKRRKIYSICVESLSIKKLTANSWPYQFDVFMTLKTVYTLLSDQIQASVIVLYSQV